jgi:hypothetical protein
VVSVAAWSVVCFGWLRLYRADIIRPIRKEEWGFTTRKQARVDQTEQHRRSGYVEKGCHQ